MSDNLSYLSGRQGVEKNLFENLVNKAKEDQGSPEKEKLQHLAKEFLMGDGPVFGAATFYDFLKPENKGIKAFVCNGTACMTAGTQEAVHHTLAKHLKEDEIGHMCCMGRCHENSAFNYGGVNYSGNSIQQFEAILKGEKKNGMDNYHVESILPKPILTAEFTGIDLYYGPLLAALRGDRKKLLDEIRVANVRGRGGAGFPMAFKLEACMNEPGDKKFIVCNADEGDPGAYTDRYLLEQRPHSVLAGMMAAGFVIGADTGVLYIRAEYPEAVATVRQAIQDLEAKNLLGKNIDGTGFSFQFKVIEGAGAYICGEETSLLSSIEGQRPEVRVRPPYPTQKGLFNLPTVVNNVETLACIPFIMQHGGAAYAQIGNGKSTGPKLVCLDGFFNRPGVYEVPMGYPLRAVVDDLGKGFKSKVKALHIGGPLGGLVPMHKIDDLSIDFESFQQQGFLLGHASILSVPEDFPILKYMEHLFEFTAAESCGKCFPCRIGSVRGQEMMEKAWNGGEKVNRELLNDLLETMELGSLCALGGGVPLPIYNALQYFEAELKPWFNNNN